MRILLILVPMLLSSCASMANRSSVDLVNTELMVTKKLVAFSSNKSPEEIQRVIVDNSCGRETKTMSSLVTGGPGLFIPVSSSMKFSVEHGDYPDGRTWTLMRGDGGLHMAVSGVVATPTAGGSDVQVIRADRKKIDLIKTSVEDGTIFCKWKDFDYPYD